MGDTIEQVGIADESLSGTLCPLHRPHGVLSEESPRSYEVTSLNDNARQRHKDGHKGQWIKSLGPSTSVCRAGQAAPESLGSAPSLSYIAGSVLTQGLTKMPRPALNSLCNAGGL